MEKPVGLPSPTHVPDIEAALQAVQKILPKLEARMIEFLAEWLVTFLMPATHVLEEYWFRELLSSLWKGNSCPVRVVVLGSA